MAEQPQKNKRKSSFFIIFSQCPKLISVSSKIGSCPEYFSVPHIHRFVFYSLMRRLHSLGIKREIVSFMVVTDEEVISIRPSCVTCVFLPFPPPPKGRLKSVIGP